MKKIIFSFISLLIASSLCAQTATYKEVANGNFKNNTSLECYIASNGQKFSVGDAIMIGTPSALGKHQFTYITEDAKKIMTLGMVGGAGSAFAGTSAEITSLKVDKVGNGVFEVVAKAKGIQSSTLRIRIELALKEGELTNSGMTKDKAIEELKKAKELLDLEIISQEEYNKKKDELMQHIL